MSEKFGELIALKKLEKYETQLNLISSEMEWTKNLSDLSKSWLISYMKISQNKLDLKEAELFYLSKIVEKEYGEILFKYKSK